MLHHISHRLRRLTTLVPAVATPRPVPGRDPAIAERPSADHARERAADFLASRRAALADRLESLDR